MPTAPDQDDCRIRLPGEDLADQLALDLDAAEPADLSTGRVTIEDLDRLLARRGRRWDRGPGRRRRGRGRQRSG